MLKYLFYNSKVLLLCQTLSSVFCYISITYLLNFHESCAILEKYKRRSKGVFERVDSTRRIPSIYQNAQNCPSHISNTFWIFISQTVSNNQSMACCKRRLKFCLEIPRNISEDFERKMYSKA